MTVRTFTRRDVLVESHGDYCAAWIYLPNDVSDPPAVLLGHGLGATREMRLDAYAERFATAGIAALAFTYRHFGDSTGEPRQLLSIRRQLEDWESALTYLRQRPDVDSARVALWGTSLGGGHALTVASRHPELRAVVVQCPVTDGLSSARALGVSGTLRLLPSIMKDVVAMAVGKGPVYLTLASDNGSAALLTAPEALPGFRSLVPSGGTWINEVAARVANTLPLYRPGKKASIIDMPALFCIGERDTITPPDGIASFAAGVPRHQINRYDSGHFDIYHGDLFESAVSDQAQFLVRQLQ